MLGSYMETCLCRKLTSLPKPHALQTSTFKVRAKQALTNC